MNRKILIPVALAFVTGCARGPSDTSTDLERQGYFASVGGPIAQDLEAAIDPVEEIRVLIFPHVLKWTQPQGRESSFASVTLENPGGCEVFPPGATAPSASGTTLTFSAHTLAGPHRVVCAADSRGTALIRPAPLATIRYRGEFEVRPWHPAQGAGGVRVINVIRLEDYLKGVVPSEMPASWGVEPLMAQAIAARSYAVHDILAGRANGSSARRGYDVDDTVQDQAYLGLNRGHVNSDQAVAQTAGLVLASGDRVARAYFSADSGGHTEEAHHVWGGDPLPYTPAKKELYPEATFPTAWTRTTTLAAIATHLRDYGIRLPSAGALKRVWIDESDRWASGRASVIRLEFVDGDLAEVPGPEFSYAVKLKSALFSMIQSRAGEITLLGRGYGHGVGMNQWGARYLVRDFAMDHRAVLAFYYEGADVVPLPTAVVSR